MNGTFTDGPISKDNEGAWRCMVPRIAPVEAIVTAFHHSPPDYISLIGPVQSGKSTVLMQARAQLDKSEFQTVWIRVDMLALLPSGTLISAVRRILYEISNGFHLETEHMVDFLVPDFRDILRPWEHSELNSDYGECFAIEQMLERILESLGSDFHLVIVLDNVDLSVSPHVSSILQYFRTLFNQRHFGPLSRMTVVTTSVRDISLTHANIVSPFNVSKKIHLPDLTRAESDGFIDAVLNDNNLVAKNGVKELLFRYSNGVSYLLQCLVSLIDSNAGEITESEIYRSITKYLQQAPGVFRFAGRTPLNQDALFCLQSLLRDEPIIPYETTPGLMELVSLGYVANYASINASSVDGDYKIRSPLITLLLVNIHYPGPFNTGFRLHERIVSQLPPVKLLLLNARFLQDVSGTVNLELRKEPTEKVKQSILRRTVDSILDVTTLPIDLELYRLMFQRHVPLSKDTQETPESILNSVVSQVVITYYQSLGGEK